MASAESKIGLASEITPVFTGETAPSQVGQDDDLPSSTDDFGATAQVTLQSLEKIEELLTKVAPGSKISRLSPILPFDTQSKRISDSIHKSSDIVGEIIKTIQTLHVVGHDLEIPVQEMIQKHIGLINTYLEVLSITLQTPPKQKAEMLEALEAFIRNAKEWISTVMPTPQILGMNETVAEGLSHESSLDAPREICPLELAFNTRSSVPNSPSYALEKFAKWAELESVYSVVNASVGVVESIRLFRGINGLRHEFILVSFGNGEVAQSWVRGERAAERPERWYTPHARSLGPIFGGAVLRETITLSTTKNALMNSTTDVELGCVVLQADSRSPTGNVLLNELGRQFMTVSISSDRYRLLSENCRFYARRNFLSIAERLVSAKAAHRTEWRTLPCTMKDLNRRLGEDMFGGRQLEGHKSGLIRAEGLADFASTLNMHREYSEAQLICNRALEILEAVRTPSERRQVLLSLTLTHLGQAHYFVSQYSDALTNFQRGLDIARMLQTDREKHIIAVLEPMARTYKKLHQFDKATLISQQIIDARRQEYTTHGDTYRAHRLARALLDHASILGLLPDHQADQQSALDEAIGLWRDLSRDRPDLYRIYIATAMLDLANCLSRSGRLEDALQASRDGIVVTREEFALRPDITRVLLADALYNHSTRAGDLGHWAEACDASQEAAEQRHILYAEKPEVAYRIKIAKAQFNLAHNLQRAGRLFDATKIWPEVVDLARALRDVSDVWSRDTLVQALTEFASAIDSLPAESTTFDALDLRREAGQLKGEEQSLPVMA